MARPRLLDARPGHQPRNIAALYQEENLSTRQIARQFGMGTGRWVITRQLRSPIVAAKMRSPQEGADLAKELAPEPARMCAWPHCGRPQSGAGDMPGFCGTHASVVAAATSSWECVVGRDSMSACLQKPRFGEVACDFHIRRMKGLI